MSNRFTLILIPLFLLLSIAGCKLNEENIDEIALTLQEKYNNIQTYKGENTQIYISSGERLPDKTVVQYVKRPDKYKELIYKEGRLDGSLYCDSDILWNIYEGTANNVNTDCSKLVDNFFQIFDKIKNLINYDFTITNEEDGSIKVIIKSKEPGHDYWYEEAWFDSSTYMPLKYHYKSSGIDQTITFKNVELNTDILDSEFEAVIPEGTQVTTCKIDYAKLDLLQKQFDKYLYTETGEKRKLTKEEFEQKENINKQIHELMCQEYEPRTYEQYLGIEDTLEKVNLPLEGTLVVNINGKLYPISLRETFINEGITLEFSIEFQNQVQFNEIDLKLNEPKLLDIDLDNVNDLEITVLKVEENKAEIQYKILEKATSP